MWGEQKRRSKRRTIFGEGKYIFVVGKKNGEGKAGKFIFLWGRKKWRSKFGKYLEKEINGDTDQLTNKANHSAICLCINVEFKCS